METIKGVNGEIAFDGATVTISRNGALGRMIHGKGAKQIPVGQISGVQLVPAGLTRGFIQFTIPGEISNHKFTGRKAIDAAKDENAVLFTAKQQPAFELLTAAVLDAISRPAGVSPKQRLAVLTDLRDAGLISEAEYGRARVELLASF